MGTYKVMQYTKVMSVDDLKERNHYCGNVLVLSVGKKAPRLIYQGNPPPTHSG